MKNLTDIKQRGHAPGQQPRDGLARRGGRRYCLAVALDAAEAARFHPSGACGRLAKFLQVLGEWAALASSLLHPPGSPLRFVNQPERRAYLVGYFLFNHPRARRFTSPYLVASQSVPVVAIAPLLVIWFGPGLFSKVLICALTVFSRCW